MKTVVFTSILPVPGLIQDNDYVLELEDALTELNPNLSFKYYRSSPYLPFLTKGKWNNRRKVAKLKQYQLKNRSINILPYFGIASSNIAFAISSYIAAFLKVNKIFKSDPHISLTHAHFIFPDGLISCFLKKRFNIPYVITVQSEQRLFGNKISSYFALKVLKFADSVVCLSPKMVHVLNKKMPSLKTEQIGLGIDNSFLAPQKSASSSKEIRILSVGSLYWVKNYEKTILAIEQLSERLPITYTIVGDGEDKEKLTQLVKDRKLEHIVSIVPFVENKDLAKFMASFDIFILASHKETWGRVYIEAMAVGLPVILTKNTGVFGIIQEGRDALVCNPADVNSIKVSIEKLILSEELRNRLAMNGQNLAMAQTWSIIALKYTHIYNTILNQ